MKEKDQQRSPLLLLFSTFNIGTSASLSIAILKSRQEFCKMRKIHFGRKPSAGGGGDGDGGRDGGGSSGKASVLRKKEGRLQIEASLSS